MKQIFVIEDLCNGCRLCQTLCSSLEKGVFNDGSGVTRIRVLKVPGEEQDIPILNCTGACVRSLFEESQPTCVSVCPTGALVFEEVDGIMSRRLELEGARKAHSLGIHLDLRKAFQTRNPDEKVKLLRWFTISRAIVESLPSCVFLIRDTLGLDLRPWWNLFTSATGLELDYQEFVTAGERVMNLERAFNVREGFRRKDDHPSIRMMTEDVPHFGYPRLDSTLFNRMLDEYYEENGWNRETSIPTRKKLEALGMGEIADEIQGLEKGAKE